MLDSSVWLLVYVSVCLFVRLSVCLSVFRSVCLSLHLRFNCLCGMVGMRAQCPIALNGRDGGVRSVHAVRLAVQAHGPTGFTFGCCNIMIRGSGWHFFGTHVHQVRTCSGIDVVVLQQGISSRVGTDLFLCRCAVIISCLVGACSYVVWCKAADEGQPPEDLALRVCLAKSGVCAGRTRACC